ncbi:MAG: TrbC/VirB2 family protein [Armatimonadota bacterium]|nr:TrbC/VirB2 family protein [Armatimonadota bacterium]MDR5703886.1 TrbC/VirB2 family protein [Armatimonadota bacterium]MDR7435795.1 TrbC/VirB2 family protein [Armatimonadota bacterium]
MKWVSQIVCILIGFLAAPALGQPAEGNGDLLSPLTRLAQQITESLVGPLGIAIGIATLAGAAISVVLGGAKSFRWVFWILVGMAILFGAPTIIEFVVGK